ncbi:CRISPR-associated protein Csx15 [uncultured Thermanaerothrix sp.]|uniref:CRISPR-associated protein Csx15 n=1 Tax=uncultured Thermanaerothrix sp. TaxID=1195149 RepID=UPI00262A65FC|nr:CRISPR-associated protein Csx15 [uncultured Thermanaerothrix sp.]
MILVNFSHPLSADQMKQLQALLGVPIDRVVEVHSQIEPDQPLAPQVAAMVDQAGLTLEEWQNAPIIVNPPSLNFSAVLLIAELHGRMGYFPACVRLRPVNGAIPPRFEVAEVLNLQSQRDAARRRRN